MGEARIVLQLMNADGEMTERYFPGNGETSILQLARDRFKPFHSEESQAPLGKQLALFCKLITLGIGLVCHVTTYFPANGNLFTSDVSGLRLMIEPSVEGVTIEPPVPDFATDTSDGRIVVNPSKLAENSHYFIHLRPEDIIHFEHHNLQIRYSLHCSSQRIAPQTNMPPAITDQEDVQVESSDPQRPDHEAQPTALSDSEDEDEAEGDPDRTTTPMNVTPATSRVTASKEVKETPNHQVNEEDAPFSTALDHLKDTTSDPDLQVNGMSSSEIELTGDVTGVPGAETGGRPAQRAKASVSRVLSFSETDFVTSTSMLKNTYCKRSRRTTPDARVTTTHADEQSDAVEQQDAAESGEPIDLTTSQIMYPKGRAHEAAARSLSRKRKLESGVADEEGTATKARKVAQASQGLEKAEADRSATAAKAHKISSTDGGEEAVNEAAAEEEEESDDDGPSQVPAGHSVSPGRLPWVARVEESDDDEIAVQPTKTFTRQKSSPEDVVRPQRASKSASKTPVGTPSSTATALLGKPPKILTSNVAGKYAPPSSPLAKFLKSQGSSIIDSVPSRRTNFLCVVRDNSELMKSPKVLRSLALGKLIVTERWINESKSAGQLLDPVDFVHPEVADTLKLDRRQLFNGNFLYFTNAVVKKYGKDNWEEMKELVTDAGASSVESGNGGKGGKMTGRNHIIYIGTDEDADATTLIEEHSRVVYHKDLVKEAVVTGQLDLEDEKYRLKATTMKDTGKR